jgi:enamine deaminase RidA (YjgF/YER057c/UK114 family)
MTMIRRINPPTLFDANRLSYSQVTISQGSTLIHVAGQAALDTSLNVVGAGDFAMQTRTAFENLRLALAAAGARPEHVVALRIYVVGLGPDCIAPVQQALESFFPADSKPPGTLIGVAALAMPDLRIEVEASAVL